MKTFYSLTYAIDGHKTSITADNLHFLGVRARKIQNPVFLSLVKIVPVSSDYREIRKLLGME